ncbi:hypothetical protein QVD17_37432 [Tagetes erecta]|uniref:Uncharacterized protein n=1 Tax=Tagetes erecta TaxID=13708 RepID=A0AAD8K0H8_TARER|nr:hypothetical protein QVD17_37432 [Tagetes erecta]
MVYTIWAIRQFDDLGFDPTEVYAFGDTCTMSMVDFDLRVDGKQIMDSKKSTEKTMIAADKINRGNEDEINSADIVELQRYLTEG